MQPLSTFASRILVVGDSISAAYGLHLDQGWVSLLRQRLIDKGYAYQVVNASVSGDTTGNGLARLPGLFAKQTPSIVIIELGGNDGLRGFAVDTTRQQLASMIVSAKKAGAKILLLGVPLPPNYGPAYINAFASMFSTLAKQYDIALVPNIVAGIERDLSLLQADGIHPTAKGQVLILNNVWPTLHDLLRDQARVHH